MKRTTILTLSGLIITLAFSILLMRLASLERENPRQREQIAVIRETATQAREAFDRMMAPPKFALPGYTSRLVLESEHTNDLDAELETLEIVSKGR